jgi:hypothetical protein
MTAGSIEHASFSAERRYQASPARVFAAWADPAAKGRWFSGPEDWTREPHELDFASAAASAAPADRAVVPSTYTTPCIGTSSKTDGSFTPTRRSSTTRGFRCP